VESGQIAWFVVIGSNGNSVTFGPSGRPLNGFERVPDDVLFVLDPESEHAGTILSADGFKSHISLESLSSDR